MPELPEVETVRRGLAPVMEGATLNRLELRRKDLRFPFPEAMAERLEGRKIVSLGRRAKYLMMHFERDIVLVCHLGMSGSYRVEDEALGTFHHERSKRAAHDHVHFHLDKQDGGKASVIYNDPRRFGFMFMGSQREVSEGKFLAGLGIEPTGNQLSGEVIAKLMAGKATTLKAALLDQRLIAGLGNIYVCEALWRAGLSPKRKAGTLVKKDGQPTQKCVVLADHIRSVIDDAITAGGSSLKDHAQADGSLGYFQHSFAVYDQEGQPCRQDGCGGTVTRIVQNGRSTFFCPKCQR